MTLFREAEEDRDETAYGMQVVKASLRDKLTDRGWSECGTCRGAGERERCGLCKVPHAGVPPYVGCHQQRRRCPDCVEGLVPPEGMVEAAARVFWEWGLSNDTWEDAQFYEDDGDLTNVRRVARAALIASARWEREQ